MNAAQRSSSKTRAAVTAVAVLCFVIGGAGVFFLCSQRMPEVRIGYFHGGRAVLLYRAYINDYFEAENVSVQLITRIGDSGISVTMPKDYEDIKHVEDVGKVRGRELIAEILNGKLDGAVVGEGSFVEAVNAGAPLIAVAELGHDTKEAPGHAMVFRNDVVIKKSEDMEGKRLASRVAGPSDAIFLREFLASEGVPEDSVSINDQVDEEELYAGLIQGVYDGALLHQNAIKSLMSKGAPVYIYRRLNWIDPELVHAVLVFHKDFVAKNPELVERILRAYMKRIRFEHSLPREERLHDPGEGFQKGLLMEDDFLGLNLPQYDLPPTISLDLMNTMQDLLLKYNVVDRPVDLRPAIDNSFVEKVAAERFP